MKVPNPKTEVPYWDEGQKNPYYWYKKGFWKKYLRKKFIKKFIQSKTK